MSKPVIAIAGLTACFGCQLTLLNCENELTVIAEKFTFAYFPMGTSTRLLEGEFTAALVEGAVSTPEDLETLIHFRNRSHLLIAYGTCARWGGINALKNNEPRQVLAAKVYSERAKYIDTFNPGPIHRFVAIDGWITGCPPEKADLLSLLQTLRMGTVPVFRDYPVCMECRIRENQCLIISKNQLCLGPVVQAGCRARCPSVGIPCEGCRGPVCEANVAAETELLEEKGFPREEIENRMRRFCGEWEHAYGHRT